MHRLFAAFPDTLSEQLVIRVGLRVELSGIWYFEVQFGTPLLSLEFTSRPKHLREQYHSPCVVWRELGTSQLPLTCMYVPMRKHRRYYLMGPSTTPGESY